jgi:hypothetical protein
LLTLKTVLSGLPTCHDERRGGRADPRLGGGGPASPPSPTRNERPRRNPPIASRAAERQSIGGFGVDAHQSIAARARARYCHGERGAGE